MNRLIEYTVFSGFVTAWRFATWPTSRSPVLVMATTEGVVRAPSWLGMTTGSPPCMTATTEFVVPKSIPIILLIAEFPPVPSPTGVEPGGPRCHAFRHKLNQSLSIQVECIVVKFLYINRKVLEIGYLPQDVGG